MLIYVHSLQRRHWYQFKHAIEDWDGEYVISNPQKGFGREETTWKTYE